MRASASADATLTPKAPVRNTTDISDLMLFMFITSFPANSWPLLYLTRAHRKKFPTRKCFLKTGRDGILLEEPCMNCVNEEVLLYFSLIAFYRLSSLRPFLRKVAEIRCVAVLSVGGKNVSEPATCRELD